MNWSVSFEVAIWNGQRGTMKHAHNNTNKWTIKKINSSAYKLEVFKCKLKLLFALIQLEVLKDTDRMRNG